MEKEEIERDARLSAIEGVVINMARIMYRLAGVSQEAVHETHQKILAPYRAAALKNVQAVCSDHFVAEVESRVAFLLSEIEKDRSNKTAVNRGNSE